MKIVLYNMRYGTGSGIKFHLPVPFSGFFRKTHKNLDALIDFFREQNADIHGLIEVDSGSYRAGRRNQAQQIAAELGQKPAWHTKYGLRSWWSRIPMMSKQANAIISGEKIVHTHYHFLKKGVKRLVIELELEDIRIFIVHLALRRKCREAQLRDLSALIRNSAKPCLVAGDFNAFAGKVELADFMNALGLQNANQTDMPTFPSHSPRWQLDFILHSPDIRVNQFEVAHHVRLSDHLPLICDFDVLPASPGANPNAA